MKHSVYYLFALLLLTACKPTVPKEYIQPGDMEDILYDYHLSQAMARQTGGEQAEYNRMKYFVAVLKKHDVTQADFDSSLVYYYSHLERLKDIYTNVNERLEEDAKMLGASVGEINRYSQYSASGDTANIWKDRTELLLMPCPMMNRYDFTVKIDTTFHLGDSFMFQFVSEYIYQSGIKDALVCFVTKYEGDSIIQTTNHVSVSGLSQVRIPANRENKLKEMRGFIYLTDGNDHDVTVRRMMFISQVQLVRFHNNGKNEVIDVPKPTIHKTDSVKQLNNDERKQIDSIRNKAFERIRNRPLPPRNRIMSNGVAPRNHQSPQRR